MWLGSRINLFQVECEFRFGLSYIKVGAVDLECKGSHWLLRMFRYQPGRRKMQHLLRLSKSVLVAWSSIWGQLSGAKYKLLVSLGLLGTLTAHTINQTDIYWDLKYVQSSESCSNKVSGSQRKLQVLFIGLVLYPQVIGAFWNAPSRHHVIYSHRCVIALACTLYISVCFCLFVLIFKGFRYDLAWLSPQFYCSIWTGVSGDQCVTWRPVTCPVPCRWMIAMPRNVIASLFWFGCTNKKKKNWGLIVRLNLCLATNLRMNII